MKDFFPLFLKADTVSHSVSSWKKRRDLLLEVPRNFAKLCTGNHTVARLIPKETQSSFNPISESSLKKAIAKIIISES